MFLLGTWENQFDRVFTSEKDFHLISKSKVKVDMMYQFDKFPYAKLSKFNAKVLEMNYDNSDMSMIIILPKKVDGLKSLGTKLAMANLKKDIFDKLQTADVKLTLPKFKIETNIDVKEVLHELDVKLVFDEYKANLSGLLENDEQIFVSKAIQKAFIEVNEEGAEAAAATGGGVCWATSWKEKKIFKFNADHPFLYILKLNDYIIFSGAYLGKS